MAIERRALLGAAVAAGGCAHGAPDALDAEAAVRATLAAQAAAWNAGDIAGFMAGYWRDARLRFASGANVTRGWNETLARYELRYPDRAAMGTLAFSDLEIEILAPDAAQVFGRWRLTRAGDAPNGLFTLLFRKRNGRWVIVSDHTS